MPSTLSPPKKLQLKNAIAKVRSALSALKRDDRESAGLLAGLETLETHKHLLDPASKGLAILASHYPARRRGMKAVRTPAGAARAS